MKILNLVLLGILILLSIATGVTKLIRLPEEMELFRHEKREERRYENRF